MTRASLSSALLSLYLSLLGKLMVSFHALSLLVHRLTKWKPTVQEKLMSMQTTGARETKQRGSSEE